MNFSLRLAALLLSFCVYNAAAKAVFAHFMVGIVSSYTQADWEADMNLAAEAGIDAFALNIGAGDDTNDVQIPNAFAAAEAVGFQLFFSFDYAARGAWAQSDVISLLQDYTQSPAHYRRDGAPFASTFEGPANAADWNDIKATTGCFFVPDWSSLGAPEAVKAGGGVADGLFNWGAWSAGGEAMNTGGDTWYIDTLAGKPYMMPVSPWFYTNLPGYGKNWMWPVRTMDLWEQRWAQIIQLQPEYVEIITWNDYGESHHIGPSPSSVPFHNGEEAYDYFTGVNHDGWLEQLSAWIQQYKNGGVTVSQELITAAYLVNHIEGCSDGGTTVNTASQGQTEYSPAEIFGGEYYISFTAVLGSSASVSVSVGGQSVQASWSTQPGNGAGVYHGVVSIGSRTGDVAVSLQRGGSNIATISGPSIGGCTEGFANFSPAVPVSFV